MRGEPCTIIRFATHLFIIASGRLRYFFSEIARIYSASPAFQSAFVNLNEYTKGSNVIAGESSAGVARSIFITAVVLFTSCSVTEARIEVLDPLFIIVSP